MLLKEIKPGMVVHCKTKEEMVELSKHIEFTVGAEYIWKYGHDGVRRDCIRINDMGKYYGFCTYDYFANEIGCEITEFSDLILPELTAEETIKLHTEVCCSSCKECPLYNVDGYSDCEDLCINNPEKAVEILAQWKSENEKKEPEIDTVDICRIIEIQPDGRKRCVHEEDMENIPIEEGKVRPSDGNIQKRCREILKRYCMEHDGEFIAVHEVVCRVKAVE